MKPMKNWSLPLRLQKYIYKSDKEKALGFLSKIAALNESSLFSEYDQEYLRFVGYYRIKLLQKWGYLREALAWACLDCELYPGNPNMIALRENIKSSIVNLPKKSGKKINDKTNGWDGIAGMLELKTIIERSIILPLTNRELYKKFDIELPNGFLFYGPPGCGKTFFANKLAEQIGYSFMSFKPSDTGSIYIHGSQLEIRKVFEDALEKAPVVLFFDEFESLVPSRSSDYVSHSYKNEVNELLAQMDNLAKKGILFVGATNFVKNIDEAILRPGRIDKMIFVGPPDFEARIEAFKMYLQNKPTEKINWVYLGEESDLFTFAEIKHVVNEVAIEAISQKGMITTDLLLKHIYSYSPSLTEEKIRLYQNY